MCARRRCSSVGRTFSIRSAIGLLLAPDADQVGFQPARVEDAVDHLAQLIDAGEDDLQELRLLLVDVAGQAFGDDGGEFLDDGQRRAEIVAGVLDEAVVGVAQQVEPRLLAGEPFDLPVRPRQVVVTHQRMADGASQRGRRKLAFERHVVGGAGVDQFRSESASALTRAR